jgi:hypothetical protein
MGRLPQSNEMAQQRTFAAPTSPHDDENVAALNRKREIALHDHTPVGHGQVANGDRCV